MPHEKWSCLLPEYDLGALFGLLQSQSSVILDLLLALGIDSESNHPATSFKHVKLKNGVSPYRCSSVDMKLKAAKWSPISMTEKYRENISMDTSLIFSLIFRTEFVV